MTGKDTVVDAPLEEWKDFEHLSFKGMIKDAVVDAPLQDSLRNLRIKIKRGQIRELKGLSGEQTVAQIIKWMDNLRELEQMPTHSPLPQTKENQFPRCCGKDGKADCEYMIWTSIDSPTYCTKKPSEPLTQDTTGHKIFDHTLALCNVIIERFDCQSSLGFNALLIKQSIESLRKDGGP